MKDIYIKISRVIDDNGKLINGIVDVRFEGKLTKKKDMTQKEIEFLSETLNWARLAVS